MTQQNTRIIRIIRITPIIRNIPIIRMIRIIWWTDIILNSHCWFLVLMRNWGDALKESRSNNSKNVALPCSSQAMDDRPASVAPWPEWIVKIRRLSRLNMARFCALSPRLRFRKFALELHFYNFLAICRAAEFQECLSDKTFFKAGCRNLSWNPDTSCSNKWNFV